MAAERRFSFGEEGPPAVTPEEINKRRRGQPNRISSARFTPLTWLPKSLFAQFKRAANIYFLFVSVLVCFDWSPTHWSSTVLPFAAVLLWTALKDLYEDMRRRRDEIAENMRLCWRYDFAAQKFVRSRWDAVLCGDILLSLQDESFPADMAIVGACQGQAFISTANLDGESNLKERRAPDSCNALLEHLEAHPEASLSLGEKESLEEAEALTKLLLQQGLEAGFDAPRVGPNEMRGEMQLRTPGPDIQLTLAKLEVRQPSILLVNHFVPRGCVLRNTSWLVSVAAYAGDDTQAWLSTSQGKAKISNLQVYLNRGVQGLVLAHTLICLFCAIMAQALNDGKRAIDFPVDFCKFWIIDYQVVPISLYLVFEVMKLLLGFQINFDRQMVDPVTEKPAVARTADLVEEMGQVRHVFSDKTGTLTQNEMRFARCFVGGKDLGEFRSDVFVHKSSGSSENLAAAKLFSDVEKISSDAAQKSLPAAAPFQDELMCTEVAAPGMLEVRRIFQDESDPRCQETKRFFMCLAVCHDAQVEVRKTGQLAFSGSSPDEVAFLEAAHQVGMSLHSRKASPGSSGSTLQIHGPEGRQDLTVLCIAPFSSDRKRMTVLCELEGEYIVFTKGADSVMGPLCQPGALEGAAAESIEKYARQGLRTLILAWKSLDSQTATDLRKRYDSARVAIEDRDRKLRDWAAELEQSLLFIGVSAIEDRLQHGVPAAISMLKEMGILIWVLTGDKTETAVEIARSCELLHDETPVVAFVGSNSLEDAKEMIHAAQVRGTAGAAIVLDGSFAKFVLEDKEARSSVYGLASTSQACICCRLAPQQKRGLIEMTREHDPARITLAIGDGANDVAMIQGAHVGIGVRGKEGNQAVQACDVAISQFRFLAVLLQCHGRRAYRRISVFLLYYIYKHVVLAVGAICWAAQSRFDGNICYPEWLSSGFSLLYTSLPVIVILGFDRDMPDPLAMVHPELYAEGLRRVHFNTFVFVSWMARAVWHGSLAWFVPSFVMGAKDASIDDWGGTFWVCSVTAFSLALFFVNGMLWIVSLNPFSLPTLMVLLFSLILYLLSLLVLGHTALGDMMQWQMVGTPLAMVQDGAAFATLCLTPWVLLLDLAGLWAMVYFRPTPLDTLRWHGRRGSLTRVMPGSPRCTT